MKPHIHPNEKMIVSGRSWLVVSFEGHVTQVAHGLTRLEVEYLAVH
jgi:hypothetical protein